MLCLRGRQILEQYAAYLNELSSEQALQYYQRSLLTYLEHMHYRDVYANSSDAMFVLQVGTHHDHEARQARQAAKYQGEAARSQ